jgi:undecaprenyl diphosphate synthase
MVNPSPTAEEQPTLTQAVVTAAIASQQLTHVAIIMDGNRRWAKQRLLPSLVGHHQGVKALEDIIAGACDVALPWLTVYAFSTENWQRTQIEVDGLMELFVVALRQQLPNLLSRDVRVHFIGEITGLPTRVSDVLTEVTQHTAKGKGLQLQVAVNYGSRKELTQAMQQMAQQVQQGLLSPQIITESTITQYLYTAHAPDPDVLIRTGGEARLSNYLLWQLAYAELVVTPTLWPAFNRQAFYQLLADTCQRTRRFGR